MFDKINHYSITNPASVYDEEALTALELAARLAAKFNEGVDIYNELEKHVDGKLDEVETFVKKMNDETIPAEIRKEIDTLIANGYFDKAFYLYMGDLQARLEALINNTPDGSTNLDVEVIDGRFGGNGNEYDTLGAAVRGQYLELDERDKDKLSIEANKHGYRRNLNNRELWEQGWISSTTGENGNTGSDKNHYIRTRGFVSSDVERVISPTLRLEVFSYSKDDAHTFFHKEELRRAEFAFDHVNFVYKIAATGYEDNILNYHSTKTLVGVDSAHEVLFLSDRINESVDEVSAAAVELGYQQNVNYRSLWSQGYIYGTNGTSGVDPRGYDYWLYSRSDYLPESVNAVCVKDGCKGRLFRYAEGEFVDSLNVGTSPVALNHESYAYRMDVSYAQNEVNGRVSVNDMWSNVMLLSRPTPTSPDVSGEVKSPFDVGVSFTPVCVGNYREYAFPDSGFFDGKQFANYADILTYCNEYANRWSRVKIGNSSDMRTLYAYRFKGIMVDGSANLDKPKIIIIAGQHGFEWGGVLAVYGLMCELNNGEDCLDEPLLAYLFNNFEFIVVPVANPYGFDKRIYKNANGVNINRNYNYKWIPNTPDSEYYGGHYEFDQPETQAIRDLINNEKNVALVLDVHAKGSTPITDYRDLNWIAAPGETDAYYKRLALVARRHLEWLSLHAYDKGWTSSPYNFVGYYEGFDGTVNTLASLDNWCVYKKQIMSLTFEVVNGFPNMSGEHSVSALNTNMLMDFLLRFAEEYAR